ncbi:Nestin [Triplophysa tibetana]|uniref:Nestin n=1 Tax=Triplophysa tibetana TaxID=1572043 RepID=A0A5A9N2L6_9TELE|nr:Nestin [Triplophysa tibetana]
MELLGVRQPINLFQEEKYQMLELNQRLESYLGCVKLLEEENKLLREEIHTLKNNRDPPGQHKAQEEVLNQTRKIKEKTWREKDRVEMEVENLIEDIEMVSVQRQKEKTAQAEAQRRLTDSRKALEEERRAQIWLRAKGAQLEKDLMLQKQVHQENMQSLQASLKQTKQVLMAPQSIHTTSIPDIGQEYSQRAAQVLKEATSNYQRQVGCLEESLNQAKSNMAKIDQEKRENQHELQYVAKELESTKIKREMLEKHMVQQREEHRQVLQHFQAKVDALEEEKDTLGQEIDSLMMDRQNLLQVKMSLGLEVATYRCTLKAHRDPSSFKDHCCFQPSQQYCVYKSQINHLITQSADQCSSDMAPGSRDSTKTTIQNANNRQERQKQCHSKTSTQTRNIEVQKERESKHPQTQMSQIIESRTSESVLMSVLPSSLSQTPERESWSGPFTEPAGVSETEVSVEMARISHAPTVAWEENKTLTEDEKEDASEMDVKSEIISESHVIGSGDEESDHIGQVSENTNILASSMQENGSLYFVDEDLMRVDKQDNMSNMSEDITELMNSETEAAMDLIIEWDREEDKEEQNEMKMSPDFEVEEKEEMKVASTDAEKQNEMKVMIPDAEERNEMNVLIPYAEIEEQNEMNVMSTVANAEEQNEMNVMSTDAEERNEMNVMSTDANAEEQNEMNVMTTDAEERNEMNVMIPDAVIEEQNEINVMSTDAEEHNEMNVKIPDAEIEERNEMNVLIPDAEIEEQNEMNVMSTDANAEEQNEMNVMSTDAEERNEMNVMISDAEIEEQNEMNVMSTDADAEEQNEMNVMSTDAEERNEINVKIPDSEIEEQNKMNVMSTEAEDEEQNEMNVMSTDADAEEQNEMKLMSTDADVEEQNEMNVMSTDAEIEEQNEMKLMSTDADVEEQNEMNVMSTDAKEQNEMNLMIPDAEIEEQNEMNVMSTDADAEEQNEKNLMITDAEKQGETGFDDGKQEKNEKEDESVSETKNEEMEVIKKDINESLLQTERQTIHSPINLHHEVLSEELVPPTETFYHIPNEDHPSPEEYAREDDQDDEDDSPNISASCRTDPGECDSYSQENTLADTRPLIRYKSDEETDMNPQASQFGVGEISDGEDEKEKIDGDRWGQSASKRFNTMEDLSEEPDIDVMGEMIAEAIVQREEELDDEREQMILQSEHGDHEDMVVERESVKANDDIGDEVHFLNVHEEKENPQLYHTEHEEIVDSSENPESAILKCVNPSSFADAPLPDKSQEVQFQISHEVSSAVFHNSNTIEEQNFQEEVQKTTNLGFMDIPFMESEINSQPDSQITHSDQEVCNSSEDESPNASQFLQNSTFSASANEQFSIPGVSKAESEELLNKDFTEKTPEDQTDCSEHVNLDSPNRMLGVTKNIFGDVDVHLKNTTESFSTKEYSKEEDVAFGEEWGDVGVMQTANENLKEKRTIQSQDEKLKDKKEESRQAGMILSDESVDEGDSWSSGDE